MAEEVNDILAEFSPGEGEEVSQNVPVTPAEGAEAGGAVDTDKMMSELGALENLGSEGDGESALEEDLDVDKMAAEATKLVSDS